MIQTCISQAFVGPAGRRWLDSILQIILFTRQSRGYKSYLIKCLCDSFSHLLTPPTPHDPSIHPLATLPPTHPIFHTFPEPLLTELKEKCRLYLQSVSLYFGLPVNKSVLYLPPKPQCGLARRKQKSPGGRRFDAGDAVRVEYLGVREAWQCVCVVKAVYTMPF